MASLLIKKDQTLVVRARLKGIPSKATNMFAELRTEKARNASNRHTTKITLRDNRNVNTNAGICEAFRDYFQDPF